MKAHRLRLLISFVLVTLWTDVLAQSVSVERLSGELGLSVGRIAVENYSSSTNSVGSYFRYFQPKMAGARGFYFR